MKNFSVGKVYAQHILAPGLILFCFVPQQSESEQAASQSPNL